MSEFLLWLGVTLGYVMAGAGTARIYYVRAADREATRLERMTQLDRRYYEPDDPEAKSVLVLMFWWLVIPGYLVYRSYRATILAPTPRQRDRAEREQQDRDFRELQRMGADVAHWNPAPPVPPEEYARRHRPGRGITPEGPTSPDYDAATVFLNDPEFKTPTQSFLDGDEIHP